MAKSRRAQPTRVAKPEPGSDPTFVAIKRLLARCRDPERFKFFKYDEPGRYEVRTDIHEDGLRDYMVPFAILEDKRGVKLTLFPLLQAAVRKRLTSRLREHALSNRKSLVFKSAPSAAALRDLAALITYTNGIWYRDEPSD